MFYWEKKDNLPQLASEQLCSALKWPIVLFKMTTLTRALGKTMMKSLSSYETMFDLVSKASAAADKPVLAKSHSKFRDRLDDNCVTLSCDWKAYKEDLARNLMCNN